MTTKVIETIQELDFRININELEGPLLDNDLIYYSLRSQYIADPHSYGLREKMSVLLSVLFYEKGLDTFAQSVIMVALQKKHLMICTCANH